MTSRSDLNPQPRAWPCCALCHESFVLRRALVFKRSRSETSGSTLTMEWCWQRDCKHRKAGVEAAGETKQTTRKAKRR